MFKQLTDTQGDWFPTMPSKGRHHDQTLKRPDPFDRWGFTLLQ